MDPQPNTSSVRSVAMAVDQQSVPLPAPVETGQQAAKSGEAVLNFAASVPSAKRAAKRWKERRSTAGKPSQTSLKSSTVPLMVANSLMSPGNSFVLCDSQCVVEISAPSGVVNTEPALQPQPVFKRRCSLTMPYPALYGSWQVQTASPAAATAAGGSGSSSKNRPSSTYDSPLVERKSSINRAERTLQRRWSTFQMNVDHLTLQQQQQASSTSPGSPPGLNVPISNRRGGRARSGDVSATIDEQTEGENETMASDAAAERPSFESVVLRRMADIPRSLTLSTQRFNNGNRKTGSVLEDGSIDTSPSVVSSYLGEDSCHQLSAIHLQELSSTGGTLTRPGSQPSETAMISTARDDDDDDDDDDE